MLFLCTSAVVAATKRGDVIVCAATACSEAVKECSRRGPGMPGPYISGVCCRGEACLPRTAGGFFHGFSRARLRTEPRPSGSGCAIIYDALFRTKVLAQTKRHGLPRPLRQKKALTDATGILR